MAYSISERELRRLRRERFIEEQERQRRLEKEIQLLQRQRDQYIVDQRYSRALNRYEPERDIEDQFSDDGLQMTLDRWSDTSAFQTDTDVRQREASFTQNPRKDLEIQYKTTDRVVRNDNREDERIGQQGLKDMERIRNPEHVIQDRHSTGSDRASRIMTAKYGNRNSEEGILPVNHRDSQKDTAVLKATQSKGSRSESLPRGTKGSVDNRAGGSTIERASSEREQGAFMSVVDKEIEDLEKRLQTMRNSCSEVLEKSKGRFDSTTVTSKLRADDSPGTKSRRMTQRDSYPEKRNIIESDREYLQSSMFDVFCEGIKRNSAPTDAQGQRIPESQGDYCDRLYGTDMLAKKDIVGNRSSEKLKESYEKDLTKLEIDSEIERLLQLRRKLEQKDVERIGIERGHRDPRRDAVGIAELIANDEMSSVNLKRSAQDRMHEEIHSENTTSQERFRHKEENGTESVSRADERQKQREIRRKEYDNKEGIKESVPSNVRFDEDEDEKCLFEGRKEKELLLKEIESILKEKEIELSDRERSVQEKEKEREKQLNPYEELLKEKERMIEQKFKELKEREEKIKEREKMLSDGYEPQRTTVHTSTQEVQQNQKAVTATKTKQDSEKETETEVWNKERDKNADTEMKAGLRVPKDESEKTDVQSTPTLNTTLDKTFYFPKFSIFSGEDPRPKTESSFEEWKYEVSCLRKDKIYSDTVIGQAIRKSLKGQAKKVLLPMGSEATVTEILERLEGVFGNVATPMSILQEFYSASQKIDESVAAWGLRLEEILQKAIEKGQVRKEDRDEMLRNKFWRSLRSEKLKLATRIDFQTIKSFDLLRKKVRAEEYEMKVNTGVQQQAIHTERKTDTAESPDSKMDLLLQRLSSLETQMKEMNKRRQGRFFYRQTNQRQNQNQNTAVKSATEPQNKQQSGTPLN